MPTFRPVKKGTQQLLSRFLYKSAYSRAFFTLYGVVFKEIRVSFRQFYTWRYPVRSFFRTIAIIFSALNRLLLGRSLKYSFGYTGEDRIIEGIRKPLITENGFYVDVGCNHPVFLSNTYGLYRKGWRGVCVDANATLIKKYRLLRPRDKAVCALVSDKQEERDFYLIENNVLSTTEPEFVQEYEKQGLDVRKTRVTTRTLTAILDELNAPAAIDILSVDAEEHDLYVLRSLDLARYTPQLIVVEDETFDPSRPKENPVYVYLTEAGYALTGFVLKNLYFVKE